MSKLTFDTAFTRLLGHEGNYSNDPKDPGGETKWGISKRSYPNLNIKDLTQDQAKAIYLSDFWSKVNGDNLPSAVMWNLFDFAVNSGISTAIRYLQKSVGVADDGHWGPMSQAAAEKMGENDMVMLLVANRMEFQAKLSTWPSYGKGWTNRNAQNLRYATQDNKDEAPWTQ